MRLEEQYRHSAAKLTKMKEEHASMKVGIVQCICS
jgi:hypothetical protein